jgi:hypothetical protein
METMLVLHAIMWRRRWRRKGRDMWVHLINIKRSEFGIFSHLYPDLLEDEEKFHGFFRMNIEQFYRLSQLVEEEIRKQNTDYRSAISLKNDLRFSLGTCYKNLYETRKVFSIILELHFFLISVLGSIMIYSYLSLFLKLYIYIAAYVFFVQLEL